MDDDVVTSLGRGDDGLEFQQPSDWMDGWKVENRSDWALKNVGRREEPSGVVYYWLI
jgi:hypothetical protein